MLHNNIIMLIRSRSERARALSHRRLLCLCRLVGAAWVNRHVLFQLCPLLKLLAAGRAAKEPCRAHVRGVRVETVLRFERLAARVARRRRLLRVDALHVGLQVVLVLQDGVAQGAADGRGRARLLLR